MRKIFLLLASFATCSALHAQVVCYSYDAAGNRTTKFVGPCPPPSSIVSTGEQSTVAEAESIVTVEVAKAPAAAQSQRPAATGKVYPNPNNGLFELQLDQAPELNAWFEVYDAKGSLVFRQQADGNIAGFDLSAHGAGEYFLFLRSPNGVAGKWKVAVQ